MNSNVWLKKLQKQKSDVHCLDVELDFGGGSYFASLRLSRGHRGVLQVVKTLIISVMIFLIISRNNIHNLTHMFTLHILNLFCRQLFLHHML